MYYSMNFDRCTDSCIHHSRTIQSSSITLKFCKHFLFLRRNSYGKHVEQNHPPTPKYLVLCVDVKVSLFPHFSKHLKIIVTPFTKNLWLKAFKHIHACDYQLPHINLKRFTPETKILTIREWLTAAKTGFPIWFEILMVIYYGF